MAQNGHLPDSPFFPLKQLLQSQTCSSSAPPHPAAWQGEQLLVTPVLQPGRKRGSSSFLHLGQGSPPTSPLAPWQERGSQCIPLSCTLARRALPQAPKELVLPHLLSLLQGQGQGTLRGHRENDPAGSRVQREDMDLQTRSCTHGSFSNG